MIKRASIFLSLLFSVFVCAGQVPNFPIGKGFFQTDFDGHQKTITNLNGLNANTINVSNLIAGNITAGGTNSGLNITNLPLVTTPLPYFRFPFANTNTGSNAAIRYDDLANAISNNFAGGIPFIPTTNIVDLFALTNNLDSVAHSDLLGFQSELVKRGVWTNLVDAIFLKPRFAATNANSLYGRKFLNTNMTFGIWGAQFNGTNNITMYNLPDLRTNTIIEVWRRVQNDSDITGPQQNNYSVGLNNSVGGGIWASHMQKAWSTIWQRANTTKPYPTDTTGFTNIVKYPYVSGVYDYPNSQVTIEPRIFEFSSDGISNMTAWEDGFACALGPVALTNFVLSTPFPYTNALTTLRLGQDMFNGSVLGSPLNVFRGEIAEVLVFNKYCDTNLAAAATVACRWLEPGTTIRVYFGDSRLASPATSPVSTDVTNAPIYYYQSHFPNNIYYHNYSVSGYSYNEFLSPFSYNFLYGVPYPDKFIDKQCYVGLGINDIYGGSSGATVFNNLMTTFTNNLNNGWVTIPLTVYAVGTNATSPAAYDVAKETQRTNFNNTVITNSYLFGGVWRMDQIFDQSVMNTNSGYSTDGLHVYGTNGWVACRAAANSFYGTFAQSIIPNLTDAYPRPEYHMTNAVMPTPISGQVIWWYSNYDGWIITPTKTNRVFQGQ